MPELKLCAKCNKLRRETLFKPHYRKGADGTKVMVRARNCDYCAKNSEGPPDEIDSSKLSVLEVRVRNLIDTVAELKKELTVTSANLFSFQGAVLERIAALSQEISQLREAR
jgi:hypothetical protein